MTRLPILAGRVTCAPFRAELSARACVARHLATYTKGRNEHQRGAPGRGTAHPTCAGCEVGRELARGTA